MLRQCCHAHVFIQGYHDKVILPRVLCHGYHGQVFLSRWQTSGRSDDLSPFDELDVSGKICVVQLSLTGEASNRDHVWVIKTVEYIGFCEYNGSWWLILLDSSCYRVGAVRSAWSNKRFQGWICTPWVQIVDSILPRQIQELLQMVVVVIGPSCGRLSCQNCILTGAFHGSGGVRVTRPDPQDLKTTWPDPTRPGPTRPDPNRPGPTRPDPTRPDPTRPVIFQHLLTRPQSRHDPRGG